MWETPIYLFEEETTDKNGKIINKKFHINVTYSAPKTFTPQTLAQAQFRIVAKHSTVAK